MGISTVSFNNAKIYGNKMFFVEFGRDSVLTKVLDNNGKLIVQRISNKPTLQKSADSVVISRKKEYELPDKNIIFEFINRIYDKSGKLTGTEKITKKY